jgi:hypothetical protein
LRGVDPGSHLLTTDDQNRVLAGRGVGDGGVVENERPMYASQHEFENGKRTNMLLLLLLGCGCYTSQRHAYEGRSEDTYLWWSVVVYREEKVKSEKEYMRGTEMQTE